MGVERIVAGMGYRNKRDLRQLVRILDRDYQELSKNWVSGHF